MSDTPLDELGPVDFIIVEFPKGQANFTGEMAEELVKLVDAGTIRVVDILILVKDDDGNVEALELPLGRSADRQRAHPHPSHRRRDRGGRGARGRGGLTCR